MAEKNIGSVLLFDDGTLVGILSERDYARKVILLERVSKETAVADIMTTKLITVEPATTVTACMELMTEKRVRHLPVLDDGDLVGLISIGDVVKAVIADQLDMIGQLEQYITSGGRFASIVTVNDVAGTYHVLRTTYYEPGGTTNWGVDLRDT